MSYSDFPNPQKCATAATVVAQDGSFSASSDAHYRIITKCVALGPPDCCLSSADAERLLFQTPDCVPLSCPNSSRRLPGRVDLSTSMHHAECTVSMTLAAYTGSSTVSLTSRSL